MFCWPEWQILNSRLVALCPVLCECSVSKSLKNTIIYILGLWLFPLSKLRKITEKKNKQIQQITRVRSLAQEILKLTCLLGIGSHSLAVIFYLSPQDVLLHSSRVPCFLPAFPQLLRVTAPVCTWRLLSIGSLVLAWAGGSIQTCGRCSASGIKTELSHHTTHYSSQSSSFLLTGYGTISLICCLLSGCRILWILQWYLHSSPISSKRLKKKCSFSHRLCSSWEVTSFMSYAHEIQKSMKETNYLIKFPETWHPNNAVRIVWGSFKFWRKHDKSTKLKKKSTRQFMFICKLDTF